MFSLGITLLELAADLVLPTNGHLWHSLRNGDIPAQYLMGKCGFFYNNSIYFFHMMYNTEVSVASIMIWTNLEEESFTDRESKI